MTKKDSLKKKVLYRSKYRGTKEMDILLSRFVGSCIDNLDEKDLLTLYEFLNYEDEVIYNFTSVIMYQIMNQKINFLKYLRISKYEILKIWRRGWDSNPRTSCPVAGFQDQCFQPLSHLPLKTCYSITILMKK